MYPTSFQGFKEDDEHMDMIRKFQEKNGMIMKEESQSFGYAPPPPKKRTEETQNRKNHESKAVLANWMLVNFFLPAIPTTKQQKEPTLRNFHRINPSSSFLFWRIFWL